MKTREVNRRIEKLGGIYLRTRGSHRVYEAGPVGATVHTSVPVHTNDIPIGTLRKIEKDLEPVFGKGWLR